MTEHILVIDDDPKITDALRRGLAYQGYRVDVAHDGAMGLDLARRWAPDVVILDILMPGLDGLEVCRRLRAGGDVPILLLTARDSIEDRVRGLEIGADDYLVKPFAYEEFLARVRALLRRRAPKQSAVLRSADLVLDADAHEVRRGERHPSLRPRALSPTTPFVCVTLGESDVKSSRETIERCGRARFIGSVVLAPKEP